jgi:CCR4-NOT transcription complex subunit 1 CAF1-binding domain
MLTLAGNRPIYAKELDIKQLLVEGFTSEKMKYVVTFVCRILKESQKSVVFKNQNPWIKAILDILREIYEYAAQNNQNNQNLDIMHEIESLFRIFSVNTHHTDTQGFLKAAVYQSFQTQCQQIEVSHMMNKDKIIPAVQPPV